MGDSSELLWMFWILTLPLWLLLDLWRPSLADAFMTPKLQTTIAAAKTMLSGVIGRSVCKRVMASPAKIKVSFSRCLHTTRKPVFLLLSGLVAMRRGR